MALQILVVIIALTFADPGLSFGIEQGISKEIDECLQLISQGSNPANNTGYTTANLKDSDMQSTCLQEYVWKFGGVPWVDFNITESEVKFINELTQSLVSEHSRYKRTVGQGQHGPGIMQPQRGFSIRREYRRLTDADRHIFHKAVNSLKQNGQYDVFAKIHQGINVVQAHSGPNFFGWHRVYCALIEQALRRWNPHVSLPYWDVTLDYAMDNPYNSIIWSPPFMGSGNGIVVDGPFANWQTQFGPLTRNIAGRSRLLSKQDLARLLTKCRTSQITNPTAKPAFNSELYHGSPHAWVGGHMAGLNSAAHDPIFFLYHAFIDYFWEQFRVRQARVCGVNPVNDYPGGVKGQESWRIMAGLAPYRIIDGLGPYWTRNWYRYEESPTCSKHRPNCGTPYLRCNIRLQQCVSVPRRFAPIEGPRAGAVAYGRPAPEQGRRGYADESRLSIGPRFPYLSSDGRSFNAGPGIGGSRKRRAVNPAASEPQSTTSEMGHNTAQSDLTAPGETQQGDVHSFAMPMPLLPTPDFTGMTSDSKTADNTQVVENIVYVPVKLFYKRPSSGGNTGTTCQIETNGVMYINVKAQVLSDNSLHDDYGIIDARQSAASAMVYMAVNLPANSTSDVMFEATDGCGRICQARCLDRNAGGRTFRNCDGIMKINRDSTFSPSLDGAIEAVLPDTNEGVQDKTSHADIQFMCPMVDRRPW